MNVHSYRLVELEPPLRRNHGIGIKEHLAGEGTLDSSGGPLRGSTASHGGSNISAVEDLSEADGPSGRREGSMHNRGPSVSRVGMKKRPCFRTLTKNCRS